VDVGVDLNDVVLGISEEQSAMTPVLVGGRLDDIDAPILQCLVSNVDVSGRNPETELDGSRVVFDFGPVIGTPPRSEPKKQRSDPEPDRFTRI